MADEVAEGKRRAKRKRSKARRENGLDATSGEVRESPDSKRYMHLAEAIGERIRAIRAAQRRSRAYLARAANLADSHLGEIERGEIAPGSGTLAKLAVALRVEAGAIFPDLALLAQMVGLQSGLEEEGEARSAPYPESGEHDEYGGYGRGYGGGGGGSGEGKASREAEMLLSPAVVAKLAHVEARTLQKWIAQGLVTPSFYVMQEPRSAKQDAAGPERQEVSRSAAFRREDLPGIIEVRNRARVRQRGHMEQVPLEDNSE